jgi:glycosyltransferase involved in cell wall biosynthesis
MTVVIPVWGARYTAALERAIASVRSQDTAVPIVVVDNASDVAVPEPEGATVVRSSRRLSVGAARDLGLEHVETQFVLMLDADDELADGALEALRGGIGADPEIAVYAMSLIEAETGARHRMPRRLVPALTRFTPFFAFATAIWSLFPIQGNAAMRTPWVRDAGGYPDCDWGDDWVVAVSQAVRGRVVIDRRAGRIYHVHPESLSRRTDSPRRLLSAAAQVRSRLRSDPGVPLWIRASVPLVAVAQTLLIVVVRPPYRAVRAILGTLGGRPQPPADAGDMVDAP